MSRRRPRSTRMYTLLPYPARVRSRDRLAVGGGRAAADALGPARRAVVPVSDGGHHVFAPPPVTGGLLGLASPAPASSTPPTYAHTPTAHRTGLILLADAQCERRWRVRSGRQKSFCCSARTCAATASHTGEAL